MFCDSIMNLLWLWMLQEKLVLMKEWKLQINAEQRICGDLTSQSKKKFHDQSSLTHRFTCIRISFYEGKPNLVVLLRVISFPHTWSTKSILLPIILFASATQSHFQQIFHIYFPNNRSPIQNISPWNWVAINFSCWTFAGQHLLVWWDCISMDHKLFLRVFPALVI